LWAEFRLGRIGKPIHFAGLSLRGRANICAFFSSTEEAHRVLFPFISEGLEVGEKALHTIDPKKRDDHMVQHQQQTLSIRQASN
jgi:hypothetical protein